MNIYYEQSMPFANEFFEQWGRCTAFNGKTIEGEDIADADFLFVRSTTVVDEKLLSNCANLKLVATATAGNDHMDLPYLNSRGINHYTAAGCNAVAVAEYVISAIFVMAEKLEWRLQDKTVGIVGAGKVGSALTAKLEALGVSFKLCDPPLDKAGDQRSFVTLDEVLKCDVVTLHVPLVKEGEDPTENLIDAKALEALSDHQVLINACRGEVIDQSALKSACLAGRNLNLVLDVWQNEPDIDIELLPFVAIATSHIAGHTNEGKARGTEMVYQEACRQLNEPITKFLVDMLPKSDINSVSLDCDDVDIQLLKRLTLLQYDIRRDDAHFRKLIQQPGGFEYIRKHYVMRREYSALKVNAGNCLNSQSVYQLGFSR